MTTGSATATLDIVSDVIRPWCYIGKRRLAQALELTRTGGRYTGTPAAVRVGSHDAPGGMDRWIRGVLVYAAR